MNFLADFVIAILTTYITLTNSLAGLLVPEQNHQYVEPNSYLAEGEATNSFFSFLPSSIGQAIPDILIQSAEFQAAAVIGSTNPPVSIASQPIDALVNIFCTYTTKDYVRTTTGTGFFVDTDGVILTNAHVAQFLLLEQTKEFGTTRCTVRTGNPAAAKYSAELLYLPPAWIQANAGILYDEVPMGTGERDYALLYVSGTVDSSPLPATFPALKLNDNLLPVSTKNTGVQAAGYPADNLIQNGPNADLIPRQATSSVSELYTFGSNYADVMSLKGSSVGAEGASGGPVINQDGEVIGVIVTRGDDTIDGTGSLRAITVSHIARTIEQETGLSLQQNLGGNLSYRADVFATTLSPFLLRILETRRPPE